MLIRELATADVDLVRSLERRRIEATRANDADALEPLLHDELIYVNSVGAIYDKKAYVRDIRTHALTYDRDFDVRETEARILEDVIILVGVMLGHSRLDGEQQVFHFPSIAVWRKDSGRWQLLAWQSSSGSQGFMLPPATSENGEHYSTLKRGHSGELNAGRQAPGGHNEQRQRETRRTRLQTWRPTLVDRRRRDAERPHRR